MHLLKAIHRRLLPSDPGIGWLPYLWLVYLSFFFIRYLFVDPGTAESIAVLLTVMAFLALYFNGYWRRGWNRLPTIIGLCLLGTAWAWLNVGASVFFIFACSFGRSSGPGYHA